MDYTSVMELAGKAGRFQILIFVLLGLSNMYPNITNMAANFLNPVHPHWCAVPSISGTEARDEYVPRSPNPHLDFETCEMYGVTWNDTSDPKYPSVNTSYTTGCQNGHYYEQGEFQETVTSEFNLVCDRSNLRDLITPIYTAGVVFGAFGGGMVSDRFGRLTALVFFNLLHLLAGVATSLSVNEWMYMIGRMIMALCFRACNNTGAVFMLETLSSKHRIPGIIGYQLIYGFGGLVCVTLAYFIRNWRWLQIALVAPLVPMVAYKWLIPESPKWLLVKGHIRASADALLRIARINRREIPQEKIEIFIEQAERNLKITDDSCDTNKVPVSYLFKHPVIRKYLFVFMWTMATGNFIFFGVTLNIDQLFGDVYMNVLVAVLAEFPAYLLLWPALTKLGRKPTISIGLGLITTLSAAGVGLSYIEGMEMVVTILYVVIRGVANAVISAHLCYISEVFPTSIRQMTLGLIHAVAGGVSIAASLTGKPAKSIWEPLPLAIYGSIAFIAALLALLLPETLGEQLPDTVDDTCNLGKKKVPVEKHTIVDKNVLINNHVHTVSKTVDIEKNDQSLVPALQALQYGSHEFAYNGPESLSGSFNVRL